MSARPRLVTLLAAFNMALGSLSLVCCFPAGLGFLSSNNPAEFGGAASYLSKAAPGFQSVELGLIGATWALSFLLIVAGVGLWRMKPWARWLCIAYCLAIVLV